MLPLLVFTALRPVTLTSIFSAVIMKISPNPFHGTLRDKAAQRPVKSDVPEATSRLIRLSPSALACNARRAFAAEISS